MEHQHDHPHDHHHDHDHSAQHESKTRWVVMLTIVTMIVEIGVGYFSNSMALTAEGWHMSTHVLAIGLTWMAYFFARRYAESEHVSFRKEKLYSLAGFTSAIILLVIAIVMVVESVERLVHPETIFFRDAIVVAFVGFIVNAVSAKLLHHDHNHGDHNIRAAYLHVLADMITSLMAIAALSVGLWLKISWLDAVSGIIGAIVIVSWSASLIRNAGIDLIEFRRKK